MHYTYDLVSEGRNIVIELKGLSWQYRRTLAHSGLQPEFERLPGVSSVEKHPDKQVSIITVTAEELTLVESVTDEVRGVLKKHKVTPHHEAMALTT